MGDNWQYSTIHNSPCKIIDKYTLCGQAMCRVWLPNQEAQVEAHVGDQEAQVEAHVDLTITDQKILSALNEGEKSGKELVEAAGYKSRTGNFKRSLEKLLANDFVQMTNPENPKASNQKYVISVHGFRLLKVREESSD